MKNISDYIVVRNDQSIDHLEALVREQLSNGYAPQGGIAIHSTFDAVKPSILHVIYAQAMVKKK